MCAHLLAEGVVVAPCLSTAQCLAKSNNGQNSGQSKQLPVCHATLSVIVVVVFVVAAVIVARLFCSCSRFAPVSFGVYFV